MQRPARRCASSDLAGLFHQALHVASHVASQGPRQCSCLKMSRLHHSLQVYVIPQRIELWHTDLVRSMLVYQHTHGLTQGAKGTKPDALPNGDAPVTDTKQQSAGSTGHTGANTASSARTNGHPSEAVSSNDEGAPQELESQRPGLQAPSKAAAPESQKQSQLPGQRGQDAAQSNEQASSRDEHDSLNGGADAAAGIREATGADNDKTVRLCHPLQQRLSLPVATVRRTAMKGTWVYSQQHWILSVSRRCAALIVLWFRFRTSNVVV